MTIPRKRFGTRLWTCSIVLQTVKLIPNLWSWVNGSGFTVIVKNSTLFTNICSVEQWKWQCISRMQRPIFNNALVGETSYMFTGGRFWENTQNRTRRTRLICQILRIYSALTNDLVSTAQKNIELQRKPSRWRCRASGGVKWVLFRDFIRESKAEAQTSAYEARRQKEMGYLEMEELKFLMLDPNQTTPAKAAFIRRKQEEIMKKHHHDQSNV